MIASRCTVASAIVALTLASTSCANLDGFLFEPVRTERYEFTYAPHVPAGDRVPEALTELVEFRTSDGVRLYGAFAWQPAASRRSAPTVIYHHGKSSTISMFWERVSVVWALGANVFVYDYRGFGRSEGTPDEAGLYRDGHAAIDVVRARAGEVDPARIYHYGESLGSGVAVEMAASEPLQGLVLEVPYASATAIVAEASLLAPSSFVWDNRFDSFAKIRRAAANSRIGVLMFAGGRDDLLPPEAHAQRLDDEIAREPAAHPHHELVVIENGTHDNVYSLDPVAYREPLRRFLHAN